MHLPECLHAPPPTAPFSEEVPEPNYPPSGCPPHSPLIQRNGAEKRRNENNHVFPFGSHHLYQGNMTKDSMRFCKELCLGLLGFLPVY